MFVPVPFGRHLQRGAHLCAQAVLGFDRVTNALAAILRVVVGPFLYLVHDFGEVPVLDAVPDPARIVTASEMEEPRLFIDPSPDMAKQAEIGSAEIMLFLGPPKPEALTLEVADRVFPEVANAFGLAVSYMHRERVLSALDQPARNISVCIRQLIGQKGKRQFTKGRRELLQRIEG